MNALCIHNESVAKQHLSSCLRHSVFLACMLCICPGQIAVPALETPVLFSEESLTT